MSSEEAVAARLQAIDQRLERLEALLVPLADLAQQAPNLVAVGVDSLDGAMTRAETRGLQPQERLQELAALLERASTPETLRALSKTLDMLESAPGLVSTSADVIDHWLAQLTARGILLDERVGTSLRALEHLTHPDLVEVLGHALSTGSLRSLVVSTEVLAPEAIQVIGCVAGALIETRRQEPKRVGMFGALGALRKPEVQDALGFALSVAEHFGRRLRDCGCASPQLQPQEPTS